MLATKLFVPTRRPALVARRGLVERLDGALDDGSRLTLVSAPAGFGKTTLLGDWLADRGRRPGEPAPGWVSLDDGDNDLARLLTHLVAALAGAGLAVPAATHALRSSAAGPDTLTALVNDVAAGGGLPPGGRRLLVLDDYHVVGAPEVHAAMAFLLDHLPGSLHLVVLTRSDPPWPLARLRSRGQLTEVRAADLRFSAQEAGEFLNRLMGLRLTAGQVDALDDRTEGWIAGLQLAALSLRDLPDQDDVTRFIDAFTGSDRFIIDYLADEVLARQPADVRDFLLLTAILDRLTGPLCDAVTGGTGGAGRLQSLERDNLFLVPLDSRRTWYRYHHLFADVLRARLPAEHPGRLPALHRAASDWHAAHGDAADAVRHAFAAGDHARAGYLVESALPAMRRTRQDAVLLGWVGAIADPVVRRSPVLSILAGWSRMLDGDLDGLGRRLDDATAALADGARDPDQAASWADTDDLRTAPATISVYRAALAQARGDVPGTVRHAQDAVDLAGPDDHFVRGAAGGYLGLAAWAAGDVARALTTFSDAVRSLHAAGNLVDELDGTVVLADLWIAAGRPGRARQLYEQALAVATGAGEPYPRATADLHVGLAELDRELGDLEQAQAHLETARVLAEHTSITENRHRWYVASAQVRAALGDHDTARDLLEQAQALYRHGFYPDVRPIPALRARLDLARGDLAAAEQWARDHDVTPDAATGYLREYEHLTLVRLLLARHRAADALTLLDRLRVDAEPDRGGSLLEIGLLSGLARDELGDRDGALADLDDALAGAPDPQGYVRLLLDEGAPMLALLQASGGRAGRQPGRPSGRREPGAPAGQGGLADPLSDRELEVLRLLAGELSGPDISRRLFVSINTLRTHTKRIFTKLDVTSRAAAVRRAHELGLL